MKVPKLSTLSLVRAAIAMQPGQTFEELKTVTSLSAKDLFPAVLALLTYESIVSKINSNGAVGFMVRT
jgi:hypothetical protein